MEHDIDNAFAELGLTPDATEHEVKAAWRRLVSQWHPDRNDSAAAVAKMQRINRAVRAIRQAGFGRPATSAGAARAGSPAPQAAQRPEEGARDDAGLGAEKAPSGDRDDGATAARKAAEPPPRTIHRRVRLTLEEAAFGCTRVLRGRITQACPACAGAGYRVLGGHCPRCHGSGATRQPSWFGWMGAPIECEDCHGGGIARQACAACAGTGKAAEQRYKVTVRLPQGVRDGDLLRVAARGGRPGSPPGDLSLRVEVQQHALFELDADGTVRCAVPVDGFAWIANRPVDVPTLDGLQTLHLRDRQLGYRLSGQGFPVERRGPRGDQAIAITPIFPPRMSTDQQILLDQLIATGSGRDGTPSDARLRGWNQSLGTWKRGRS